VHDLLGVRVLVRSLNEVAALRRVVEQCPEEANGDPRYAVVRVLQKALAEQLNAADLLLAKLQDAAAAVRDSIGPPEAAYGTAR
jgi:hypothetical protein